MRVENLKIKLTIPIPINQPDCNGVVYTKEAVENAVNNLRTNLPIVYADSRCKLRTIGATTGNQHIVTWDHENQICNLTIDGIVLHSGAETIINEMTEDGRIDDFRIASIALTI